MNKIFKKLKKWTMNNRFVKMMQNLGTREMTIISSVIIAVTLAIILIMAFIKSTRDNALDDTLVQNEETAAEGVAGEEDMPVIETATAGMKTESTPDTTVLAKKEGAKEGYLNRCVFLGDSRTVSMVNYGFFNDDAALAQIGISHPAFATNKFINNAGKEYTLKTYLESHQAPVIYILLGVNGINDPSESHYQSTFVTLIDNVIDMAPNSNVVLVAIGPVDDNGIYKNSVQNAWIDKYNDFLLKTAKEKHIFYLDIAEILKGPDGQVKSEYNGGDGLHYSGKGCEAIFRYIVEHPVPGISDDGKYVVKYIKPDPKKTKVTMDDKSGIDGDKLKGLMDMMMGPEGDQTSAAASSGSSNGAASAASSGSSNEAASSASSGNSNEAAASASSSAEKKDPGKGENPEKGGEDSGKGEENPGEGEGDPENGEGNPGEGESSGKGEGSGEGEGSQGGEGSGEGEGSQEGEGSGEGEGSEEEEGSQQEEGSDEGGESSGQPEGADGDS